jgi:hypothetical protein
MGYSTTLYAVDLDRLRAAVGSSDATLVERARAAARGSGPTEVDPTQGPRIKVTRNSQIILNGRPMTLDELRPALRDPRWDGTNVLFYHERGHKQGIWSDGASFMRALGAALGEAAAAGTRMIGIVCCATEEELIRGWDDVDELSAEQATADLVAGTFTRPECSYGYGLELLCQVLGDRLGVIGGKGRLKALKLETPLCDTRSPVPLPQTRDFPSISFLSTAEVRAEVERLAAMDLAFPKSAAVEEDRRSFLQWLRSAAGQGRAVVSFSY